MTAFRYHALNAQGHAQRGTLEADSARHARAQLRAQGLVPTEVQALVPTQAGFWQRELWPTRVFTATERALWWRQLASLVAAGLPLERSLTALRDEATQPSQAQLMAQLHTEVSAGHSLAHALGQHPRHFNAIDIAVIAAGEQSGQLATVLLGLADDAEQRLKLRQQLLAAALYPAIVSGVSLLIVLFLLSVVVPRMAEVFAAQRQALPWLTEAMLWVSSLIQQSWAWGLAALVALAVGGAWALRQPRLRLRWDARLLRLPVLGRITLGYHTARFAATLAMLTSAGVPLLKALQAAAHTLGNAALQADALRLAEWVREGAPLASGLQHQGRWPSVLTLFTRLGEQTGDLSGMLAKASRHLSDEVQRRSLTLTTWLEPVLVVAMGLMVLLIVLSVMLPIVDMNALVR